MSTREKIFAAIVTIFFVCLVVWAVRTAPPTPPTIDKEKIDPPTVLEYEGNTLVEEVDGVVIWELTCSKMRIDSVTQLAELDGVIAKLYQHEKDKVWQLTADKGVYDQNNKMIHVAGNVIVAEDTDKQWQLTADKGAYDQVGKLIYVEGNVIVTENNDKQWQLTADKGTCDPNNKLIHVEGEVVVQELADEDKKSWQLTADKGAYDQTNKLIHAEGNVVVINNEGAKLTSNLLDWFGEQEMLVATGEVKISKDDMRAFGDLAYSNNGFKHFGLMGNAKLLKGVKDDSE